MTSDEHDPTAGYTHGGDDGDIERAVPDPTEPKSSPDAHLTHAQRVERVNAYLRRQASRGIWSAIE